ncbi:MAG TPA: glycerol kinase GlpK [Phycisphaerae bacterium]|nr:glycerol kinase GlpK [Phycisphaerae bacterium]
MFLALDQGTTSSRALVFSSDGRILGLAQRELGQIYPHPGWVEHDPLEIWESQLATAREAIQRAGIGARQITAVGLTNQRETTLLWDRTTGQPLANAIVWQDRRTAPACDALRAAGHANVIRNKTGLEIDAYFSATKLAWLLDHIPAARRRAAAGELAAGTVDSWLLFNLTAGRTHATDISNASRTMLLNIHTGQWDDDLLALFNIPRQLLPQVLPSDAHFADIDARFLGAALPLRGIAGDQQAALFGQNCTRPGLIKNTYGTGCFLLMHTGTTPIASKHRLLTTIAWQHALPGAPIEYALEGSVFTAGAAVQWLRDGLGIINSAAEVEPLAASVPDSAGVFVIPAFAGLGAPYWDPHARAAILGLTRGATKAHIARAALEAIAHQVADLVDAMQADAAALLATTPLELHVDGGASANNLLLQLQSDLLALPVVRAPVQETTALGAAKLAGLTLPPSTSTAATFTPTLTESDRHSRRTAWHAAVRRVCGNGRP